MDARWGWALATLAVAVGWWQMGWPGVVLAVTVTAFWLLLQFSRTLRVMRDAASAPKGRVANAVMLHSRLQPGLTLLQVLPMTGSLGEQLAPGTPAPGQPEQFRWTDEGGDSLTLSFSGGKLQSWALERATPEALTVDKTA